jgi:glycosyltransferase involved in cell wall biosynthesis
VADLRKVCIVCHTFPRTRGEFLGVFIEELSRAYTRVGCDVTVLLPYSPQWKRTAAELAPLRVLHYRYMPVDSWHIAGYGTGMTNDLKVNPINYFCFPLMLIFGVIHLARLMRRETFDFVHAHWGVPNGVIAVLARAISGSKSRVFSSFPGSDVRVLKLLGPAGRALAKILDRSDYVSCNSRDLQEDLIEVGLTSKPIDLVIYATDHHAIKYSTADRLEVRMRLGIKDDEILILQVGRFVAKKGFSTGFRALKRIVQHCPDARMVTIGAGPLADEYRRILASDGVLDRVNFPGILPTHETRKFYSACDIMVMPSTRMPSDGLNVVVVEAMACARPIVATRCGGNDLVVINGQNGFLHDEGDHEALADRVIRLCEQPQLREQMGRNSRALVDERFNWLAVARHYLEKYGSA